MVGVKSLDVRQQNREYLLAVADTHLAARKKIILDIRNDQGIMRRQTLHPPGICPMSTGCDRVSHKGLLCLIMANVQWNNENRAWSLFVEGVLTEQ